MYIAASAGVGAKWHLKVRKEEEEEGENHGNF